MGRYVVAATDIAPGVIIMAEPALMVGPKQDTLPICLGCHKRLTGTYLCSKCSFPLCSKECEQVRKYYMQQILNKLHNFGAIQLVDISSRVDLKYC